MGNDELEHEADSSADDAASAYAQEANWWTVELEPTYTDTVNVSVNAYGFSITFGVRNPMGVPRPSSRVHMGHGMAVVLERLIRRTLLQFELTNDATIQVPQTLLEQLKLRDEDLEALLAQRRQRR